MSQPSHADADTAIPQQLVAGSNSWLQPLILTRYRHWIAGICIFILAIVFCFYHLGTPSIWFDEAFSVELARQPLSLVWRLITGPEPNMELYYLLLHFWLQLTSLFGFQPTEFIVRFPSALSASCCALIIYMLGRRAVGLIGGCLAACLYILSDLQLTYAQQTRGYALQSLLLCLSFLALWQAILGQKHQARWWTIYTIAGVLAVYTHLFSVLVLLAQGIALAGILLVPNAWQKQSRSQFKAMLLSAVNMGVLLLPVIILTRHGSKTGWLPVPHLSDIYHLFQTFSGNQKFYFYGSLACICAAILIVTTSYLLQYQPRLRESVIQKSNSTETLLSQQNLLPWLWLLLCWLVIPIVASFIVSQGATRLFSSRYLVVVLPAFFLLVASGVTALRNRGVQALLIIELLFLTYSTVPTYYRSAQVEDWNVSSAWLVEHYQPGDGLVCYDNIQGCQISMEYYLHAYPANDAHFSPDSPGFFSWETYNFNNAPDALDTKKLAAYGTKHPHLFLIIARLSSYESVKRVHATEQWLDTHFHYADQFITRTATIRIYATSTQS